MLMNDHSTTRTLLIVWHSRTGAARQLAEAASQGAASVLRELETTEAVSIVSRVASEASAADLLNADAYLFCAPENLASVSGDMKEFFDRTYYEVLDRLNGRPYALAIAAGSDGNGALKQVERICTGWRLRLAAPPYIAHTDAQTPESILAPKTLTSEQCQAACELGGTLAALLA